MDDDLQPGEFVEEVPKQRKARPRVDEYGLDEMAEKCKARPGVPLLAGTKIPYRYSNALRTRKRDPYLTPDGQVKISIVTNGETPEDRSDRLVDVYFVYEPFNQ